MGFETDVYELFDFVYHAKFEDGLKENEYDHVLIGYFDGFPNANPDEVDAWEWTDLYTLGNDLVTNPENYTYWFRILFERFCRAAAYHEPMVARRAARFTANA